MRGREEKQSSVGGEDWRKYEMRRNGKVCVGVMVNRWDGGIHGVTWWSWRCGGREKWMVEAYVQLVLFPPQRHYCF